MTTPGTTNDHHRLTTTEYEAGAANQVTMSDNSATAMSQPPTTTIDRPRIDEDMSRRVHDEGRQVHEDGDDNLLGPTCQ